MGNIIVLFDLTLFSIFYDKFLSFFPPQYVEKERIIYYMFFLTCISRPIGGIFFGYISDFFGKEKSLILSIVALSLSSSIIAITPSYSHIGILSTIIVLLSRLIQGISMSGEEVVAAVFATKIKVTYKIPPVSFVMSTVFLGVLLSYFVALFILNLNTTPWIWRSAFLIPLPIGICLAYLRYKEFFLLGPVLLIKEKYKINIKKSLNDILLGTMLIAPYAASIYFYIAYLPHHLSGKFFYGIPWTIVTVFFLLCSFFCCLLSGMLLNIYKARMVYAFSCICLFIAFCFFSKDGFFLYLFLSISTGLMAGSIMPILFSLFPKNIITTASSLSFNISMLLFGSTIPLLFSFYPNISKYIMMLIFSSYIIYIYTNGGVFCKKKSI